MYKIIALVALISFILMGSYFFDMNQLPSTVDEPNQDQEQLKTVAPHFLFKDLDGKTHSLKDFEGKIIILNFWASWCAPCLEEFPLILKHVRDRKDDIVFIAISSDASKVPVLKFMNRFVKELSGIESYVKIGLDPTQKIAAKNFSTLKLPETFIINRRGEIIKKITGSQEWKEDEMSEYMKLLK